MLAASPGAGRSPPDRRSSPPAGNSGKGASPEGKDSVRATTTTIGKGNQELRDVAQSVTVVTEKLIDDRNLDTLKDALRNTAGITFLAAEGGEEDIRLRGFSLQATGDIFLDGMRDPAFYDRDTFFLDRVEVLRGSASMLFGRGSTGGAVNMVTKAPRLITENQIDVTLGSYNYRRVVGDFNVALGDNAPAPPPWHQGRQQRRRQFARQVGRRGGLPLRHRRARRVPRRLYHLDNNNGMNYGMPYIRPSPSSPRPLVHRPLPPENYYGMASDYNAGSPGSSRSAISTASARQRAERRIRNGDYERDQRAGTVRFANAAAQPGPGGLELRPQHRDQPRHATEDPGHAQPVRAERPATRFDALGVRHEVLAGVDLADENKEVFAARSAAQGGVTLTKPTTTVGTPDDGAWIDEGSRVLRLASQYESRAFGAYAQDLIEVSPGWKLWSACATTT